MISNKKQDTKYTSMIKYAYHTDYIARNKKAKDMPAKIWIIVICKRNKDIKK